MPLTADEKEEVKRLLEETQEPAVADRLTEWEKNFLESITTQFEQSEWLSKDKQIPKLREIVSGQSKPSRGVSSRRQGLSYRTSEVAGRRGRGPSHYRGRREDFEPDDIDY